MSEHDTDPSHPKHNRHYREIVVPGEILDTGEYRPGIGTYKHGPTIYAAQLGVKNTRSRYMNVVPLSGRYLPRPGDLIIGLITDLGPTNWYLDINSPYYATLHVNEVPWRVDFGDTARYLDVKDAVLVKVHSVDEVKRVQVSMKGSGLRLLREGHIMTISASKVPRVIGKNGSMISLIKRYTKCKLFVGQNGRIWIRGATDEIVIATQVIHKIEREAHRIGLTNAVHQYLATEQARHAAHYRTADDDKDDDETSPGFDDRRSIYDHS